MDFLKKKWVRYTGWIVLFLDLGCLIVGGVTKAEISEAVELAFKAVGIIAGIIAFIGGHAKIKDLQLNGPDETAK